MKELENIKKDEVEIVSQNQIKKEVKLVASVKPYPGHKCFELDFDTGKISLAKFEKENVLLNDELIKSSKNISVKRRVITKENCLYTTALNEKNAKKRFLKMINNGK